MRLHYEGNFEMTANLSSSGNLWHQTQKRNIDHKYAT